MTLQDPLGSGVVRMFGSVAAVVYRLHADEILRRRRTRTCAVTGLGVLDALMGLPLGLPVAVSALGEIERARVAEAPAGAVERRGGQVIRRAVPPLTPRLALVPAAVERWRAGLKQAGRFAPFCERAMLVSEEPSTGLLVQACDWGVGVVLLAGEQVQVLLEPERYVVWRHTPGRWWFAEELYRQVNQARPGIANGDDQADRLAQAINGLGASNASAWWSRLLMAS